MVVGSAARGAVAGLAALAVLASGCSSTVSAPKPTPSPDTGVKSTLTLAVYGARPVLDAYAEIAARFSVTHPETKVKLQPYPTHDAALAGLRTAQAAGNPPDLFLMDHDDLSEFTAGKALQPVDALLAERQVDFGDGYTRSGLEAFSADSALQCMPLDVSPLVVYYNPKLIELDPIAEPGANAVSQEDGWSLEEFGRAALQPRAPGQRGLYIAPDLEQTAPFVWSGGGEVVDDDEDPTRLMLSEGTSADAMRQLLELVRDPALTFSQTALARRSALERFKDGELGMLLGYRDLTPELRDHPDLIFDVMPLPKISSGATSATMSGLCISSASEQPGHAADLLAEVISEEGAATLAKTGYVMPSNLSVLNDDAFLQSGKRPLHAGVFGREVRDIRLLPSTPSWPLVRDAAAASLAQLFYQPVILPLEAKLAAIDDASEPLFAATTPTGPTAKPSASP